MSKGPIMIALAPSSMALDVYVWPAQRLHRIPSGQPLFVAWVSPHEQFGQGFARVRDFRANFGAGRGEMRAVNRAPLARRVREAP